MAQLTVKINGYAYTVGCEDGQEQHLRAMSDEIEARIESIKSFGGPSGESRLLVLAALLMADELHDQRNELASLRKAASRPARAAADPALNRKIARLARRAEDIAADLDRP